MSFMRMKLVIKKVGKLVFDSKFVFQYVANCKKKSSQRHLKQKYINIIQVLYPNKLTYNLTNCVG